MKNNFVKVAIQRLKQTSPFKPSICSLDLYAGVAEPVVKMLFFWCEIAAWITLH